MDAIEKRARELLAAEYAKGQFRAYTAEIRDGTTVAFDEEIRAIVAIITALTPPEGYVLVPVEPTETMRDVLLDMLTRCHTVTESYDALLAARPEVP